MSQISPHEDTLYGVDCVVGRIAQDNVNGLELRAVLELAPEEQSECHDSSIASALALSDAKRRQS